MTMKPIDADDKLLEGKRAERVPNGTYAKIIEDFLSSGQTIQGYECSTVKEAHRAANGLTVANVMAEGTIKIKRRGSKVFLVKLEENNDDE